MALPVWSTTLSVLRAPEPDDAWPDQEQNYVNIAEGVRAHLSAPRSAAAVPGDERALTIYTLLCDPLPPDSGGAAQLLNHFDILIDESNPELAPLRVMWCTPRFTGSGLEHWKGEAARLELEQRAEEVVEV